MIDFEWYRSFISIYKHRSVSAAAQARILTQPAMSQHLAALEAEVGELLFIRAPRKMIPTDKGKELYTKIVPLIENLESVSLEMKHTSSKSLSPILRLGTPVEYFTKKVIPRMNALEVRLMAEFGVTDALIDKLQKDEIDLVIATQKLQIPGIEYKKIEVEKFVITVPFDCQTELNQIQDMEKWLSEQKWLSYGLDLPIVRRFWREHFGRRPEIESFHLMPDLRAILKAIENGMGISILPNYLINESIIKNRVKILLPDLWVENILFVAFKIKHKENPLFQTFIQELTKS